MLYGLWRWRGGALMEIGGHLAPQLSGFGLVGLELVAHGSCLVKHTGDRRGQPHPIARHLPAFLVGHGLKGLVEFLQIGRGLSAQVGDILAQISQVGF